MQYFYFLSSRSHKMAVLLPCFHSIRRYCSLNCSITYHFPFRPFLQQFAIPCRITGDASESNLYYCNLTLIFVSFYNLFQLLNMLFLCITPASTFNNNHNNTTPKLGKFLNKKDLLNILCWILLNTCYGNLNESFKSGNI